jgi:signal transduction histidine kinase
LTLAFVVSMSIVLAATGALIYERTRSDLDSEIDGRLAVDVTAAVAVVRDDGDDLGDPRHDPIERLSPDGFVQVLGPGDAVLGATEPAIAQTPVIAPAAVVDLARSGATLDVASPPGESGSYRLAAARTQDDGVRYYVIAGTSLGEHDEALGSLRRLLLIGGPLALLISALLAYRLIGAALRPVEAMRSRAAEISESEPGQRLPVPSADDEISQLGRTLNAMLDRLESALERERLFVADASHELRTPLSILRTEVDLALSSGRSPEELRAALVSAGEEVDRLSSLAEDLLLIARADQGRLPVRWQRFDGPELARRVIGRLPEGAALPDVAPAGDPELNGDPERIEQVLANLLDNAARYGGGADRIALGTGADGCELHVLDRGPGFPADVADRAFHRFAQGGADRSSGGAGLGLAIVALIATAHGGEAGIEGREGGGSDVWIRWPRTAPERPAASPSAV